MSPTQAPPRVTIHDSAHARVIHQPRSSDVVVVTFNGIGTGVEGQSFWGDAALAREGLGAIGVVSTRANWFPRDPALIDAVRDAIARHRYRRVVTYGHSQGGYGALKYANTLGARTAIASCPQWSISLADIAGIDDRFVRYHDPALHDGMRIESPDTSCDAFVCFDPRGREDSWHAARIAERIECTPVLTPFAGHAGFRVATRAGIGRSLLRALIDPSLPAPARAARARRMIRAERARSPDYWLGRAEALCARPDKSTAAERALAEASARAEDDAALLAGVATLRMGRGETDAAVSHARRAATLVDPGAVDTVLRIWDVMDKARHGPELLPLLRAAVARAPYSAFLRLHLAKTLLDVREASGQEAMREVAAAANHAGESIMMWKHIERACETLGQVDGLGIARRQLARLAARSDAAAG